MANHVMVFAFDPASIDLQGVLKESNNEELAAGGGADSAVHARGLASSDWRYEMFAENAPLNLQVRGVLSSLQRGPHSCKDATGHCKGHGCDAAQQPTGVSLNDLCSALRRRGLHAQLVLPTHSGGVRCGRRSTGGGGQCVAAAGRVCYFCSRQPYAVVYYPSPNGATACSGSDAGDGSFLTHGAVLAGAAAGATEVLVEPSLSDIFRAAPSTPDYAAAVAALPEFFVGSRTALLELANKMCDAMAVNFRCQGLDIPPWRRRSSVLDRWAPHHQQLLSLSAPGAPPIPCGSASHCHRQYGIAAEQQTVVRTEQVDFAGAATPLAAGSDSSAGVELAGTGRTASAACGLPFEFRRAAEANTSSPELPSPPRQLREPPRSAERAAANSGAAGAEGVEAAHVSVSIGETIAPALGTEPHASVAAGNCSKALAPWAVPQGPVGPKHAPAVVVYGFTLPNLASAC